MPRTTETLVDGKDRTIKETLKLVANTLDHIQTPVRVCYLITVLEDDKVISTPVGTPYNLYAFAASGLAARTVSELKGELLKHISKTDPLLAKAIEEVEKMTNEEEIKTTKEEGFKCKTKIES